MPGAGRLCPPGCRHSGTRGNVTSPRVICGGDAGPMGRAGGEGGGQRGGGQRPSPAPHRPSNASPFPRERSSPRPSPQERPASGAPRPGSPSGTARPAPGEEVRAAVPSPSDSALASSRLLLSAMSPPGVRERRVWWLLVQSHRHSRFSGLRACRLPPSSGLGFSINFLHMAVNTVQ